MVRMIPPALRTAAQLAQQIAPEIEQGTQTILRLIEEVNEEREHLDDCLGDLRRVTQVVPDPREERLA